MKNGLTYRVDTYIISDGLKEFVRNYAEMWSSQAPNRVLKLHSESSRLSVNDGETSVGKEAISEIVNGFMSERTQQIRWFLTRR